ncbi:hypothetical protein [Leptospira bouyouniensis]|uniref:SDR family NAD(P)-dependent oxidoreductase n=1 Tax=Leptospira bouyouniensis TaxID=2484911 RepID=A0A7I0HVM9_9LEPT|nr:hypothetical protein [Leptospira bouyouniensis]TGK52963.1 hypothetical protein EHQ10_04265 [Leptospira bouyouniensis]TGL08401.1 hypothetical protein EHQ43_04975 [Leptospira bouyouniensis]TGM87180.1 hypothetical protein EHQ99_01425 [Leptospira bouyouniensis]
MGQNQYLIIGGAGEAGQSAITAIRSIDPSSFIISTTTTNEPVSNSDLTLFGKRAEPGLTNSIVEDLERLGRSNQIQALIYTPALGEVGFPIAESTNEQIKDTLGICLDPMVDLEKKFQPKLTVAYSAFYWLSHTLAFYGSMGIAKYKADLWAFENPSKRRLVRAGTFFSKSVRGISIVLQRTMKKTNHPDLLNLKSKFESSNEKFMDFFLSYAWEHEKEAFQNQFTTPYRPTVREDLTRGLTKALQSQSPIVTVLGDWTWEESAMPTLPNWFQQF